MARLATCPKCGEELNIPDEFYGKAVRCAGCANVFTPSAQAEPRTVQPTRDDDEELPSRRANRDDDLDDDRPRRGSRRPVRREMRSAPRRSSSLWVWLVLGGLFSVCALGCGGVIVFGLFIDNPKMQPYDSPDGAFHAGFPGPPIVAVTTDELSRPKTTYENSRKVLKETFFVHSIELKSKPNAADAEKLLDEAVNSFTLRRPGSVEIDRDPTNVQGYPAREVELSHPDDTATFVRFIVVGKRLYLVGLSGNGLVAESQRLRIFWDEFRIKDADAPGTAKGDDKTKAKDVKKKSEDAEKDKAAEKGKEKVKPKLPNPDDDL